MLIAGVDEAGRGPAIGPMVMAVAVIEAEEEQILKDLGARDSKFVPVNERERLYPVLKEKLYYSKTEHVFPKEMDELMDWQSLNEIEAMKIGKLLNELPEKPDLVFVDSPDVPAGNFSKRIKNYLGFNVKILSEHKADVNYPIVSTASIIAKVERDIEIKKLQKEFKSFGNIGSGYSHDERTISFLESYLKKNQTLPHCARKKWETNRRLVDAQFQTKLF
jgi:ribonuclease HII